MLRQIAPQYIDTGKAKVVYHNFAVIGNESIWAAEAADCAGDQNKFWDYSTYLLENQAGENQGAFTKDKLKQFAVKLNLDTSLFNTCLDSDKYKTSVQQELNQGQSLGVRATPTFFVNGQKFEGMIPADQLTKLIDSLNK